MLKARVGDEWLRGQLVDGGMGIFPKSYVEVVVSETHVPTAYHVQAFVCICTQFGNGAQF